MAECVTAMYVTTSRLIVERLEAALATAWQFEHQVADPDVSLVRVVGAGLALIRQHTVDGKGRCRICIQRRRWRRVRRRPCTVYGALMFYLTQPDALVLRQLSEPDRSGGEPNAAERTVRLPRLPPK